MQTEKNEIMKKLEKLAFQKSHPFCYHCYKPALSGTCKTCGSDDLMRATENGVEYGTTWIIEDLITEHLNPIDADEEFEESVRQCFDETITVLWMKLDAVTVAKESDPISWRIAKDEWLDQEVSEKQIMEFNSKYYRTSEIETFLDQELIE